MSQNQTSNRGFAAMDQKQQRAIASMGGKAAHMKGTAHEFSSDEARQAGKKGGESVSRNREHMAQIGRKGGEARGDDGSSQQQAEQGDDRAQHVTSGQQSHESH